MVPRIVPKHQFILSSALQGKSVTVKKLEDGSGASRLFCVTREVGSFTHLFSSCGYARSMWKTIGMVGYTKVSTWETEIHWLSSRVKQGRVGTQI